MTINDSFLRPPLRGQTSFKELLKKISGNHYLSLENLYPSMSGYCYVKKIDKKKTRYLTASHLQLLWNHWWEDLCIVLAERLCG